MRGQRGQRDVGDQRRCSRHVTAARQAQCRLPCFHLKSQRLAILRPPAFKTAGLGSQSIELNVFLVVESFHNAFMSQITILFSKYIIISFVNFSSINLEKK